MNSVNLYSVRKLSTCRSLTSAEPHPREQNGSQSGPLWRCQSNVAQASPWLAAGWHAVGIWESSDSVVSVSRKHIKTPLKQMRDFSKIHKVHLSFNICRIHSSISQVSHLQRLLQHRPINSLWNNQELHEGPRKPHHLSQNRVYHTIDKHRHLFISNANEHGPTSSKGVHNPPE